MEQEIDPGRTADAELRAVYQTFQSSSSNEGAGDRKGPLFTAGGGLTFEVLPRTFLRVGAGGALKYADENFEAYNELGGDVELTHLFAGPLGADDGPWSVSVSAGYAYVRYDEPDPQIDPDDTQRDHRFDGELSLNIPLSERWQAVAEAAYTDNRSNYDTEEFDNLAVTIGATYRFSLLPVDLSSESYHVKPSHVPLPDRDRGLAGWDLATCIGGTHGGNWPQCRENTVDTVGAGHRRTTGRQPAIRGGAQRVLRVAVCRRNLGDIVAGFGVDGRALPLERWKG